MADFGAGLLTNPMFMIGQGLMQSSVGTNPWGGISQGLLARQQVQQQNQLQQARMQHIQLQQQRQEMLAEQARVEAEQRAAAQRQAAQDEENFELYVGSQPPEAQAALRALGPQYAMAIAEQKAGIGGPETPSAVREYEYYAGLSPEEQARYLRVKRAGYTENLGNEIVRRDAAGNVVSASPVQVSPDAEPALRGRQAEEAKLGTARGEAAAQLPGAEMSVARLKDRINEIENHPGLPGAVGPIEGRKPELLMGANELAFMRRLEEIQGGAFLEARTQLKGGGEITENESARAEAAFSRMSRAQSEADFKLALRDFEDAVEDGLNVLRARAGVGASQPAGGASAPAGKAQRLKEIENKYR